MSTRLTILKTAVIGAVIGVMVLAAFYASAPFWYGNPAAPIALLLSPGAAVALFNPQSSAVYFLGAFAVQAVSYAIVALIIRAVFRRITHRGTGAV